MKKLSFSKVLSGWFVIALISFVVNSFTLKSSMIHSVVLALLGIVLFVYPVYPNSLENRYDEKKCKVIIRVIAVIEIILSFFVQTTF